MFIIGIKNTQIKERILALAQGRHRDKCLDQDRGREAHREITLIAIPFQLPCPGPNQFVVVVDNNIAINVQQLEKLVLYAKAKSFRKIMLP